MKDIKKNCILKNRLLVWLMYAVPISLTGIHGLAIWTLVQIILYSRECSERKEMSRPLREREEIIEMNKEENLSKNDKEFLKANHEFIKISEGVWIYERK